MKFKRFKSLTFLTLLLGAWSGYAQLKPGGNEKPFLRNSDGGIPGLNLEFKKNEKGEYEISNAPSPALNYLQPELANHNFITNSPGSVPGSMSTGLMFGGLTNWNDLDGSDESVFNGSSDDIEDFDPSSFSCSEVNADSLMKAAQDLNWATCFEGKLSWTRSNVPEKELLKSDQNVCGCLKGFTKVPGVAEIMSKNVSIKRSKNVAQVELNDILNGLLFQTYSWTGDKNLTTKYANNLYGTKSGEEPTKEKLVYDANTMLVNDIVPYPENQCLSPRVFMLTRQLPNKHIKSDLNKPFSEENWNYKLLEKRYAELMSLSMSQREAAMTEILNLKEKLYFLNRNPVIKYSFAVDVSKAEKPEDAKKLKEFVFKELQALIPDSCNDINSKCYQDYKNKMAELMKEPRLIPALRKEARLDHGERIKRKLQSSGPEARQQTPTQRGIVDEFMEQYRLPNPDMCEKDTTKGIECLEIYSGYCRTLDKYADDINVMSSTQPISMVYDDLDKNLNDDFNPDINTNEQFKTVNDVICNRPVKRKIRALGYPETATFSDFVKIHCKQRSNPGCGRKSTEDYDALREAWGEKYTIDKNLAELYSSLSSEEKVRLRSIVTGKVEQMSLSDVQEMKLQTNRNQSDADLASELPPVRGPNIFDGSHTDMMAGLNKSTTDGADVASVGQSLANNVASFNDAPTYDEIPVGYANNFSDPVATAAAAGEIPKVEEMSEDKRRELLSDWQKDYDDWKKEKGDSLSPSDKAKDSEYREEIATLKALLDQQKQISEQQYKLLNDAIVAKKEEIAQLTPAPQEVKSPEKKSGHSFAATARAVQEEATDLSRAPASIKEVKYNTSGAMGGASAAAAVSKRSSSLSDGSNESVAREQAKLVNMRRYSDGSITIESSGQGQGQANAITVSVSDEQYKMLQVNPSGLNLGQIERSIPKEQIAKLEKTGEIIILLQNGSNPPFEVKVAKRDNRLVYSLKDKEGKDQAPVRRVHTREALAHELKARN